MSKHQDLKIFDLKLYKINMGNFHPLEVVGRGSETQLQESEIFLFLIQRFKLNVNSKNKTKYTKA